jgi:hypothetical protein
MRILVLTAAAIDYLRKSGGTNSQILEYVRGNGCDKILLCGARHCGFIPCENISIETTTAAKLFRVLRNVAREYKNLCAIAITHLNEQKIIENYLKSGDKLNVCFINLGNGADKYKNYTYADIGGPDSGYFSVKFRKYGAKLPAFNVYKFPLANVQQI